MPLLLFDIDGTLLTGLGPYETSLEQAVQEVFNQQVRIDLTHAHGKTDKRILKELLEQHEISFDELSIERCLRRFGKNYSPSKEQTQLIPGVEETIPRLSETHILGLVTGNVREMARKKLRLFSVDGKELNDYFRFGGFGDKYYNRARLITSTVIKGGDEYRWDWGEAYVIGDTPLDIQSVLEASKRLNKGIITIGVTTGRYSGEALQQAGARHVINSLTKLPDLI